MLKVVLRGLDKVGRDNPAPGELKPWDIVGDGGAGSHLWRGTPRLLGGADITGRLWEPIWVCPSTAGRVLNHSSSSAALIPPSLQREPTSSMESARTLP